MPEYTDKLEIPLPLGNETVNRDNRRTVLQTIEQNAAREQFVVKSLSYDSGNNRIEIVLGPGIAELFNSSNATVFVTKEADTTYYIDTPSINTTYYVYVNSDGSFGHNTTGNIPGTAIVLWEIATGTQVSTLTATDKRAVLSASGARLAAHLAESASGAHNADNIEVEDTAGNFTAADVEGVLAELFQSVSSGKTQVGTAITDEGGTVNDADGDGVPTFTELANAITTILTNEANLVAANIKDGITLFPGTSKPVTGTFSETASPPSAGQILTGKEAFANGAKIIGSMPNVGQQVITPGTTNKGINAGYHNGNGYVVGDADLVASNIKKGVGIFGVTGTFTDTLAAPAAGDIINGKEAWANGSKITGSMPNVGQQIITPGTANKAINAGRHDGTGYVVGDPDLVAGNIKQGASIFGVNGNVEPNPMLTYKGVYFEPCFFGGYTYVRNGYRSDGTMDIAAGHQGDWEVAMVTESPVDLTDVSSITVNANTYGYDEQYQWYFIASTIKEANHSTYDFMDVFSSSDGNNVFNVSSLTGSFYIRLHAYVDQDYGQYSRLVINSIT